jgi:FkbM family methyltransferase
MPPSSWEERLRALVVPARLRLRYLVGRELRKGEPEFGLLPHLVPRGRIALDVGANKGVWAARMLPYAKEVHAFEPNPKVFKELDRLMPPEVARHPIALGSHTGEGAFLVPHTRKGFSNQGGSLSRVKVTGDHATVKVKTARLDDLDLRDVGFMKIDVEGYEVEVIHGARNTIAASRPNMVVEMEERHAKRPIEDLVSEVTSLGYRAYALVRGCLCPFEQIDMDRHHRNPAERKDYIFNFIFFPEERPAERSA